MKQIDSIRPNALVCICIATYKRPKSLSDLLESLALSIASASSGLPHIVIVDNHDAESAREAAEQSPVRCQYVCEPQPGISAARNTALALVPSEDKWVVFIDDDETVSLNWYQEILNARRFNAAIVNGPVVPIYPSGTPRWIIRGRFFERTRYKTGAVSRYPATNNALVARQYIAPLDPPYFSDAFSATGGSDSAFFARITHAGGNAIWCDEAVVYETVPASRATLRWIFRRNVRLGNVSRRVSLASRSNITVAMIGICRAFIGAIWCAADLCTGGLRRHALGHFAKGIGMVRSAAQRNTIEYSR